MDTRISSEMLACAMAAGLCSVGADVIQLGVVPTPAVPYLAGKYKADAGVMISASHNSAEFNGIKLFSGDGYKLPDELEEQIETIVLDREKTAAPERRHRHRQGRNPSERRARTMLTISKAPLPTSLAGMSVAVDCANGSASATARQAVHRAGRGLPHSLSTQPGRS